MLTLADIKRHVAQNRPAELDLDIYMGDRLVGQVFTGATTDVNGAAYERTLGEVLRIVEGYDELGKLTRQAAEFDLH